MKTILFVCCFILSTLPAWSQSTDHPYVITSQEEEIVEDSLLQITEIEVIEERELSEESDRYRTWETSNGPIEFVHEADARKEFRKRELDQQQRRERRNEILGEVLCVTLEVVLTILFCQ